MAEDSKDLHALSEGSTDLSIAFTPSDALVDTTARFDVPLTVIPRQVVPDQIDDLMSSVVSSVQVDLSWTLPNEGSSAITGITLQWSTDSFVNDVNDIALGAGVTSYSHTGLTTDTEYSYRIFATNSVGDATVSSVVTATPVLRPSGLRFTYLGDSSPTEQTVEALSQARPLQVTSDSAGAITVTSSNEAVVTAVRGAFEGTWIITPLTAGSTDITVSQAATEVHAAFTATLTITVTLIVTDFRYSLGTEASPTMVGLVTANDPPLTFESDNSATIAVVSSNTSVLTVVEDTDNNTWRVNTLAIGSSTITITQPETSTHTAVGPITIDVTVGVLGTIPSVPSSLTAVAQSQDVIRVRWAVPDDGGNPISAYLLTTATTQAGLSTATPTVLGLGDVTISGGFVQVDVDSLSTGSTHFYQVAARNEVGDSGFSSAVSATTWNVPLAPTGLQSTDVEPDEIHLSWTAPDSRGTPITNYILQWNTDGSTNYTDIDVGSTDASYVHEMLMPGTTYYYRVAAVNAVGTGAYSSVFSTTTEVTVPGPPTSLQTTDISFDHIDLIWMAPSNTGGAAITGYVLQWNTDGSTNYTDINIESTDTTYVHEMLMPGTTYYYRVAAVNSEGTSVYSGVLTVETDITVPAAPTSLQSTDISSDEITLSWVAPTNNGGAAITGYVLQWNTDGGTDYTNITISGTGTTYVHDMLTVGTTYYYRVAAVNSEGAGDYSSVVMVETEATAPGIPTNLAATASSDTQINLVWTAPSNNGGVAITGYKVQWNTDGSTDYTTVDVTDTSYMHTGLIADTVYYYRVAAVNSVDTGSYTDVVTARTQIQLIPVSTLEQLNAIRYDLDGDGVPAGTTEEVTAYNTAFPDIDTDNINYKGYELINDLNFLGSKWEDPVKGTFTGEHEPGGWEPIGTDASPFTTMFDGGGHKIEHLYIDRASLNVGLFGNLSLADSNDRVEVRNLRLTSGYIHSSYIESPDEFATYRIGAVAASVNQGALMSNCFSFVEVTASTNRDLYAGGLVGQLSGTSDVVSRLASGSNVSAHTSSGVCYAGGLVGNVVGKTIQNTHAQGNVSASGTSTVYAGGLVGYGVSSTVEDSYAANNVYSSSTGTNVAGGLIGSHLLGTITTSYYDGSLDLVGTTTLDTGSQTLSALQTPTSNTGIYATWDDDIWDFGGDSQYPVLEGLMTFLAPRVRDLAANVRTDTQIDLSWTAPVGRGSDITGYVLQWSTDNFVTILNNVSLSSTATSYEHMNRTPATTYYYNIFGVNSAGNGLVSSTRTVTTTGLVLSDAVDTFQAGPFDRNVLLNNAVTDDSPHASTGMIELSLEGKSVGEDLVVQVHYTNPQGFASATMFPNYLATVLRLRHHPIVSVPQSVTGDSLFMQPSSDDEQIIFRIQKDISNYVDILTGVDMDTGDDNNYANDAQGGVDAWGAQWGFGTISNGNATVRIWGRIVALQGSFGSGDLVEISRIHRDTS